MGPERLSADRIVVLSAGNTASSAAHNSSVLQAAMNSGGNIRIRRPGHYYFSAALNYVDDLSVDVGAGVNISPYATLSTNLFVGSATQNNKLTGDGAIICTSSTVPSFTNVDGLEVSVRIEDASGVRLHAKGVNDRPLIRLTREIGVKPVGLATNNNSSADRTWFLKLCCPDLAGFDAVRVVIYHGTTSSTTVYSAIVAATETAAQDTDVNRWRPVAGGTEYSTLDATESYGWKSVTWAGAANKTSAAGTATAHAINVSDWIPLSSVPRADGGSFPLVMVRVAVGTSTSSWATTAPMSTATDANGGFIVQGGWTADVGGAYVSNPAANNPSGALSQNLATVGIQFRCRNPGISIIGIGDSLTQCQTVVTDGLSSWGWRAAAALSAAGIPCGFVNNGQSSQAMDVFTTSGLNAITAWTGANMVCMQAYSPNGPVAGTLNTDAKARRAIEQQAAYVHTIATAAKSAGMELIVNSPLPSAIASGATQSAILKAYNDRILAGWFDRFFVDWWTDFTDGASPARINSTYLYTTDGLGVHANETGVARQGVLLKNVLRTMFR